jgi:hypothetical protein
MVYLPIRKSGPFMITDFLTVLGILMFLSLPDPDPLVRGADPDPAPEPSLFS